MKLLTNYRYWALYTLALVCLFGLMAVPNDTQPLATWCYVLISSKVVSATAGYIAYRLYRRWDKQGSIKELTRFLETH